MPKIEEITTKPKRPQTLAVRYARRPLTKKDKILRWVVAVLAAIAIVFLAWYHFGYSSTAFIDGGKYQAIFTTNNQAYFGKLQRLSDGSYRLTNVYYLQQAGNTAQKANTDDQAPQLIKMGSEIHGPEDAVIFDKSQVLFWENLKSDGKVSKAIDDYLKK